MIVLNKKKVLFILGILTLFIFAYAITGYNVSNTIKKEAKAIETVALPVNNKVIVIDAGHGKPDERGGLLKSEKVAYIRYFKK